MPYSMQLTEQIPNDPPRMGAKSTTTSNHPSTPVPWRGLKHTEQLLKKCGSMAEIRKYTDKHSELVEAWQSSLRPVLQDVISARYH